MWTTANRTALYARRCAIAVTPLLAWLATPSTPAGGEPYSHKPLGVVLEAVSVSFIIVYGRPKASEPSARDFRIALDAEETPRSR